MTIREATRLLTKRGGTVGWFNRRPGMPRDLRYAACVLDGRRYELAIGSTVQATYDDMTANLERVEGGEGT